MPGFAIQLASPAEKDFEVNLQVVRTEENRAIFLFFTAL